MPSKKVAELYFKPVHIFPYSRRVSYDGEMWDLTRTPSGDYYLERLPQARIEIDEEIYQKIIIGWNALKEYDDHD